MKRELRRELRLFGAEDAEIERLITQLAGDRARKFEVWACNWPVLNTFLALSTQWRVAAMGGATGLDYATITPTVLRGLRVAWKDWPEIFSGLRVMEAAALAAFGEKGAKPGASRAPADEQ